MKVRNGFVSNSSTSSFVICFKPAVFHICETCGRGTKTPDVLFKESHAKDTCVECDDPQQKLDEWQRFIDDNNAEIAKLEILPAGQTVLIDEGEGMTPEEKEEYINSPYTPKVWSELSSLKNRNHHLEMKIGKLKRIIADGYSVIWATVNTDYDRDLEDAILAMEKEKQVFFFRG
jgi:hypothetical protein